MQKHSFKYGTTYKPNNSKRDKQAQELYEFRNGASLSKQRHRIHTVVELGMSGIASRRARAATSQIEREQAKQCLNYWSWNLGAINKMNIPVIHDDGTENEFEIDLCCKNCVYNKYKWNNNTYDYIRAVASRGNPIKLSSDINSEQKFIEHISKITEERLHLL